MAKTIILHTRTTIEQKVPVNSLYAVDDASWIEVRGMFVILLF